MAVQEFQYMQCFVLLVSHDYRFKGGIKNRQIVKLHLIQLYVRSMKHMYLHEIEKRLNIVKADPQAIKLSVYFLSRIIRTMCTIFSLFVSKFGDFQDFCFSSISFITTFLTHTICDYVKFISKKYIYWEYEYSWKIYSNILFVLPNMTENLVFWQTAAFSVFINNYTVYFQQNPKQWLSGDSKI